MTLYGVNALISIGLGSLYLFRESFMPYHEAALGRGWQEIEPALQVLLGALMDVAGAGWVAVGVAVIFLVAIPVRREERWARLLVPALFLIFYGPTLLATLTVLDRTPASPPWYGNAIACSVSVLALIIDAPWRRRKPGDVNRA
jgi:hypothetical protein